MPGKKEKLPLSVTHPELAKEADGWDASAFTYGSGRKMKWRCPLGHSYETSIDKRTGRKHSCPYCSGHKVLPGFNDLASSNPELAAQAFGWDPTLYSFGSDYKAEWICEFGHIWKASIINRVKLGQGCAVCANRKIIVGVNDLQTTHPEIAAQAHNWDPSKIVAGSEIRKEWICNLSHTWKTTPKVRTRKESKCPICTNRKVLVGFNDLATTHPGLAKEAYGWDPSTVTLGSNFKKKWKCQDNHYWVAEISSRTQGRNCPSCSKTGFDPNQESFLYFITHNDWNMHQIGITNDPDTRVGQHKNLGWELLELRGPMDGHLTQQWETAILRMLKAKGADLSNEKIAGKFDGYSEAWSKSTFQVGSIKDLMRLTEDFEAQL